MNWNVNQVIRHEKNNSAINFYAQLVLLSYEAGQQILQTSRGCVQSGYSMHRCEKSLDGCKIAVI